MADETKKKPVPFWTTEKTTLYAPKGAKFHTVAGQKVEIHPRQKEKFLKLGYCETEAEALDSDAHPAIAAPAPVKRKGAKEKAVEPDPNKGDD
jgi:hypothetical protein